MIGDLDGSATCCLELLVEDRVIESHRRDCAGLRRAEDCLCRNAGEDRLSGPRRRFANIICSHGRNGPLIRRGLSGERRTVGQPEREGQPFGVVSDSKRVTMRVGVACIQNVG